MANPLVLTGGGPIPGKRVPMGVAKERAGYQIAVLPSEVLKNPCTGVAQPVTLHDVWVAGQRPEPVQTATTYNLGLWMSVVPVSNLEPRVLIGDELAPVDQAFSPDDFPETLHDDSVRGHSAWVRELEGDPADDPSCAPDTIPRGAGFQDFHFRGNVSWVEDDLNIYLTGPFSAEELKTLAEGIRFE